MADFISAIYNGLKGAFGIYLTLLSIGVILDQFYPKEDKRKLTDRLNGVFGDEISLVSLFLPLFDRIFDPNKTGRPRFLRSVMVSLIALVIISVIWWSFHPQRASETLDRAIVDWSYLGISLLLFAISINLIGDFISLWETRIVIGRMATAGNSKRQAIWLITDLILTVMIYSLGLVLGLLLLGIFTGDTDPSGFKSLLLSPVYLFIELFFRGGLIFSCSAEIITDPFSIFFFTTLLTSVWVWIFMLGNTLWPLLRKIHHKGNVEEYPVLVSMVVGGAFLFPIIAVVLAIIRLFFSSSMDC